jgi:hypothetical protein
MSDMENPSLGYLDNVIGWVDNPRDVCHNDIPSILPVLDGKILDGNMALSVCH